MNLGQAVAVCLYELSRDPKAAPHSEKPIAVTASDLERLTSLLLDALHASGYLKPRSTAPTEEKIRHLVRRLQLSAADAELCVGMLRQILWKLRSGPGSH